jgi:hypothetical protein
LRLPCHRWRAAKKALCLNSSRSGIHPAWNPIWTTTHDARLHGFMVFDTLYGQAAAEQCCAAMPRLVAGHTIENDGKTWTLILRDGLVFHDGRNFWRVIAWQDPALERGMCLARRGCSVPKNCRRLTAERVPTEETVRGIA